MTLQIEKHLNLYQKKECEFPTYQEMIIYIEEIKIIGLKKGIKIELLEQNKDKEKLILFLQSIKEIPLSINEKTKLELDLEKYRLKERDFLKYTEVYILYNDLFNFYVEKGIKYCKSLCIML